MGLAFAMVFGLVMFAGTNANAQDRRDDRNNDQYRQNDRYNDDQNDSDRYDDQNDNDRYNGRDRNGNESYRFAFHKGYQDGVKQGMRERSK